MTIIAVECHYGQYCHYGHDHFRYKHDVVRLQWVSVGFTAWVMIDTPDFCFVFLHCYMAVLLHFAAQPWWNIFPSTQDTVYRIREHRMQDTGAGYNNCFYRASQKKINQGEMILWEEPFVRPKSVFHSDSRHHALSTPIHSLHSRRSHRCCLLHQQCQSKIPVGRAPLRTACWWKEDLRLSYIQ